MTNQVIHSQSPSANLGRHHPSTPLAKKAQEMLETLSKEVQKKSTAIRHMASKFFNTLDMRQPRTKAPNHQILCQMFIELSGQGCQPCLTENMIKLIPGDIVNCTTGLPIMTRDQFIEFLNMQSTDTYKNLIVTVEEALTVTAEEPKDNNPILSSIKHSSSKREGAAISIHPPMKTYQFQRLHSAIKLLKIAIKLNPEQFKHAVLIIKNWTSNAFILASMTQENTTVIACDSDQEHTYAIKSVNADFKVTKISYPKEASSSPSTLPPVASASQPSG